MRTRTAFPLLIIGLLIGSFASAQVKIGDNPQTIDPTSVLELESTERVLVITRVDSIQMSNIVPNRGALVYNTSADCVFYYNGTDWINLCDVGGGVDSFTTDPIVNPQSTIVITPTPTGGNIEIAQSSINSSMIIDGGINGIDIQNGSIGRGKLQNSSVDRSKLAENSVGPYAIDNDSIDLADFNNITGFIRDTDVISSDADNAIVAGGDGGAFYDASAVAANTAAIAAVAAADADQNPTNEIQTLSFDAPSRTINLSLSGGSVTLPAGTVEVDGDASNELITASELNGNILTITEGGNPFDIDLTGLGGGGGGAPTVIISTPSISVSGDGSTINPYELATVGTSGGGTTEVIDGIILTGFGTPGDPFTIVPGTDGQFLSTNIDGEVVWTAPPNSGGGGGVVVPTATDITVAATALNYVPTADNVEGHLQGIDIALASGDGGGSNQNLGQVLTQGNDGGSVLIRNILNPVDGQDAATKSYVDAAISSGGGGLADGNILVGDGAGAAQQVQMSGDATIDNTGVLTIAEDGITTTKILDGQVQTNDIADTNVTDAKIAPGAADQILRTTADGSAVAWVDFPTGTVGGGTVLTDGITITGDGVGTSLSVLDGGIVTGKIADANVTDAKIAPGAADQILRTSADGSAVTWVDFPVGTGGGGAVSTDGTTISGDGDATALSVPNGGITSAQIADATIATGDIADDAIKTAKIQDANVTDAKIAPGAADQILRTSADGSAVTWVDFPVGTGGGLTVISDETLVGDGSNAANALGIADGGITATKLAADVVGEGITRNATTGALEVDTSTLTGSGVITGNGITVAGGNAATFADVALGIQDGGVTAAKLAADVVGAGITKNATTGALEVDTSTLAGSGDITGTGITVAGGNAATFADVALGIQDGGITAAKLAADVVGEGIARNATTGALEVDTSTLTGSGTISGTGISVSGGVDATFADVVLSIGTDAINTNELNINAVISENIDDGAIESVDIGTGQVQTINIAENNVTPDQIKEGLNGQVLKTDNLGDVVWTVPTNLETTNLVLSSQRSIDLNGNDLLFNGTGSIGIGTLPDDPLVKLRVNGQVRGSTFRSGDGSVNLPAYRFESDLNSGMFLIGTGELGFSTDGTEAIKIDDNQNVGIGSSFASNSIGAKLHVDGDIWADGEVRASGLIIENDGTPAIPDYVFQKYFLGSSELKEDYNFKTLKEIDIFIKNNHHLPGIKSALEVKKEGSWNLSESNLQNLEKIEELFLHTIEQEKKINRLQSENQTLSDEVKALQNHMEEIKTMLKKLE